MTIAELLLPEVEQEMTTTRRVLERVPDDKLAWKPHDRSWSMGDLASHIANAGYMVHPDQRGSGLGRMLVEHSIAEARRLGFDALMFNMVFESNPARRLYERLGFEAVGRVPEAVAGEDALVYWRRL